MPEMFREVLVAIASAFFVAVLWPGHARASGVATAQEEVTIDDLVTRTIIPSFSLSPDGQSVAFLTVKGNPWKDDYEVELFLENTSEPFHRVSLARYRLTPREVFDADTHAPFKTVSQYVWSPDSAKLLYTTHTTSGMELRLRTTATSEERVLIPRHEGVQIEGAIGSKDGWEMTAFDHQDSALFDSGPKDAALSIEDGFRIYGIHNSKPEGPITAEHWLFRWANSEAIQLTDDRKVRYFNLPETESWDGHSLQISQCDCLPATVQRHPKGGPAEHAYPLDLIVDISPESSIVSIRQSGSIRKIYEEDAILLDYYAELTDRGRRAYMSDDGRLAVMLKSTNRVPDSLVALDLRTGEMRSLFAPNEGFAAKTRQVTVRKMLVPAGDISLSGRLFLPGAETTQKPYPLVFVPYLSTPGFNLSDEIPILALLSHGIAVFSLHSTVVGRLSGHDGDFSTELRRVEIPRLAMEWVVKNLSAEGTIDAARCGVGGLSYGAETAMYVYWKSNIFRAVSSTTGSWEPSIFSMGGLAFAQMMEDRGYPKPKDETYSQWKRLSAGLNARANLPPLLWQSPDQERFFEMESWLELRRAGAQIDWLEYPDEGHTKRHPANDWWVKQRNLDWFRFWLKGEVDETPAKAEQYSRWRQMLRQHDEAERDHGNFRKNNVP